MQVLGIDPSLTSLGFAYGQGRDVVTGVVKTKLRGMPRILYIRDSVMEVVDDLQPTLVAYEGYAMGKFTGQIFDRAELGGVLKSSLYERKIQLLLVPPTSLKLFATGKGNSDKDAVKLAMAKVRGRLFSTDDEADAFTLLRMGYAYCDPRQKPRDPRHYQHTALRGCQLIVPSAY